MNLGGHPASIHIEHMHTCTCDTCMFCDMHMHMCMFMSHVHVHVHVHVQASNQHTQEAPILYKTIPLYIGAAYIGPAIGPA